MAWTSTRGCCASSAPLPRREPHPRGVTGVGRSEVGVAWSPSADTDAVVQDFAATLPGVDPGRLALWGFSLSGGHVLRVAATDRRVAAAIAQTPNADCRAIVRNAARYQTPLAMMRLTGRAVLDAVGGLIGRPPRLRLWPRPAKLPGRSTALNPRPASAMTRRVRDDALLLLDLQFGRWAPQLPEPANSRAADKGRRSLPTVSRVTTTRRLPGITSSVYYETHIKS